MRDWTELALAMLTNVPHWLRVVLASIVLSWLCFIAILAASGTVPWVEETIKGYAERLQGSATRIENAANVIQDVVKRVEVVEQVQERQQRIIMNVGSKLADAEDRIYELELDDWRRGTKVKK